MFAKILNMFNINIDSDKKKVNIKTDIVNHNIQPINNANYQPENYKNNDIINSENINKNWQYRKYMTENANNIREYNYLDSANSINYTKRPYNSPIINSNDFTPTLLFNDKSIRNDSDLKKHFLDKQNNMQIVKEIN